MAIDLMYHTLYFFLCVVYLYTLSYILIIINYQRLKSIFIYITRGINICINYLVHVHNLHRIYSL